MARRRAYEKSKKFIALSMVLMSVLGFGIVSNAQTLPFEFRIGHGGAGSSGPASKEDNEQNAKYYLIAQDSEYVVNGSLYAYGRWTP